MRYVCMTNLPEAAVNIFLESLADLLKSINSNELKSEVIRIYWEIITILFVKRDQDHVDLPNNSLEFILHWIVIVYEWVTMTWTFCFCSFPDPDDVDDSANQKKYLLPADVEYFQKHFADLLFG